MTKKILIVFFSILLICFTSIHAEEKGSKVINFSNISSITEQKIHWRDTVKTYPVYSGDAPIVIENMRDDCICFDVISLKYDYSNGRYVDGDIIMMDGGGFPAMNNPYFPAGNSLYPSYEKGSKYILTEPGVYHFFGNYHPWTNGYYDEAIIIVEAVETVPTSSKIYFNHEPINIAGYNVNGNNYFKLRDIAMMLSKTGAKFNVVWNEQNNCVELDQGTPYVPVGGELSPNEGQKQWARRMTNRLLDHEQQDVSIKGFNINDNNYFKLRDLGEYFDFSVAYDEKTNSIYLQRVDVESAVEKILKELNKE